MTTYLAQYDPQKNTFKILKILSKSYMPMLSQEQFDAGIIYLTEKDFSMINPKNIIFPERLSNINKNQ